MIISGKEIQRLSYKLCQEVGEENNLELLNRVALFLYYDTHVLGCEVKTDAWRVVDGSPILFDRLPKYSECKRGTVQDWYWCVVKDRYSFYLKQVEMFLLIDSFYPSEKLKSVTAAVSNGYSLQHKEVMQIAFFALHV